MARKITDPSFGQDAKSAFKPDPEVVPPTNGCGTAANVPLHKPFDEPIGSRRDHQNCQTPANRTRDDDRAISHQNSGTTHEATTICPASAPMLNAASGNAIPPCAPAPTPRSVARVRTALDELPLLQRAAIELAFFEGRSAISAWVSRRPLAERCFLPTAQSWWTPADRSRQLSNLSRVAQTR